MDEIPKTEEECFNYLKEARENLGIVCSVCGGRDHIWNENSQRWTCQNCGHNTRLTSDTAFHSSHLPLLYWFKAIQMIINDPSISARKIQLSLGHKRYQPIWEMVKKIKSGLSVKSISDEELTEFGSIELGSLDDGENLRFSYPDLPDLISYLIK